MTTTPPNSSPSRVTPETPWMGLRSYEEDSSAYFFGRERELADLFERVALRPLTVLFGQSGLGKTSLLRAALIPRLRRAGFLPVLVRLDHGSGAASLEAQVISAITPLLDDPGAKRREGPLPSSLWLMGHDPIHGLYSIDAPRVIVLFDQFEEIFTQGEAGQERRLASEEFLHSLADLVENRVPDAIRVRLETDEELADRLDFQARPIRLLFSLREDYLHRLERWRSYIPSLMDNRLELRPLNGEQALQSVVAPGKLRCREHPELPPIIDEATGVAIVRFVAGAGGDVPLREIEAVPPLLSLLCSELNAQRGKNQMIRFEQVAGSSKDILAEFYERCFIGEHAAVRRFVEDRLLSPQGFREGENRDSYYHILEQGGLDRKEADDALARLIDARVLISDLRGGIERIELTHDTLTGVVRASRDKRRLMEEGAERRRQRRNLLAAAFALALLLTSVSLPFGLWAMREKARAEEARDRAEESEALALRAQGTAENLIKSMLFDLRDKLTPLGRVELLEDVSRQAEHYFDNLPKDQLTPAAIRHQASLWLDRGKLLTTQGKLPEARTALTRAMDFSENLVAETPDDHESLATLAAVSSVLGDLVKSEGSLAGARSLFERSLGIREDLAAADPENSDRQRDLSTGYQRLAGVCEAENKTDEAETLYRKALQILESLSKKDPGNEYWQRDLSVIHSKLGMLARNRRDIKTSRQHFEADLKISEQLAAANPDDAMAQSDLSLSLSAVGSVLWQEGNLVDARRYYQQSLAISDTLSKQDPKNLEWRRGLLVNLNKMADLELESGDRRAASDLYQRSLEISRELSTADPGNTNWRRDLAVSLQRLGDLELGDNEVEKAGERFQESLKISLELVQLDPRNTGWQDDLAVAHKEMGKFEQAGGRFDSARSELEAALKIREQLTDGSPENPELKRSLAILHTNIASLEMVSGNFQAAVAHFEKASAMADSLSLADPSNPARWQDRAAIAQAFGIISGSTGESEKKRNAYRSVVTAYRELQKFGIENPGDVLNLAKAYFEQAKAEQDLGNLSAAEPLYQEAVALAGRLAKAEPSSEEASAFYGETLHQNALLFYMKEDAEKARELFTLAGETYLANLENHPKSEDAIRRAQITFQTLGLLEEGANQFEKAAQYLRKARQILEGPFKEQPADPEKWLAIDKLLNNEVRVLSAAGLWAKCAEVVEFRIKLLDPAITAANPAVLGENEEPERSSRMAGAWSRLSWYQLLAGQHRESLASAEQAVAILPQIWIEGNLANALLYNAQWEKARTIYEKNRGKTIEEGGTLFDDGVRSDLKEFRRLGMLHPDLEKAEALFPGP